MFHSWKLKLLKALTSLPDVDRYMSVFCIDENHYMDFYSRAEAKFHLHKVDFYAIYIFFIQLDNLF